VIITVSDYSKPDIALHDFRRRSFSSDAASDRTLVRAIAREVDRKIEWGEASRRI